jgi:branched-chain amino acid transport system substrate-binding protein
MLICKLINTATVNAEVANQKPKIGIILPLTGKAASAGEVVKNSAILANRAHGNYCELIFEDNALDNSFTKAVTNKLLNENQVNALVVYASGPSIVASSIAEKYKVPMIGMSIDPSVSSNKNWVMIHWASSKNIVNQLLGELEKRKLRKIAIVTSQVQGIIDLEKHFFAQAEKRGFELVYKEQVLPTEIDFASIIAVLRQKQPEAIFVNLYYGQAGIFANKLRQLGSDAQLFSHFIFDDPREIETGKEALNGAFFANTSKGDLSFDQEYLSQYGVKPGVGGISAYDIISLYIAAFKNSDGTKFGVMKYLHSLKNFSGKTGTISALTNNSFDVPASIRVIKSGEVKH